MKKICLCFLLFLFLCKLQGNTYYYDDYPFYDDEVFEQYDDSNDYVDCRETKFGSPCKQTWCPPGYYDPCGYTPCEKTYPPHYFEQMAGSYEQIAAAYERMAYDFRDSCGRILVGFEYLYWHADNGNLDYAIDGVGTNQEGQLYQVNPGWDSGYRIFAGYQFPCDDWLLEFNWTRFTTTAERSTMEAPGLTLFSTRGSPSTGLFDIVDAASGAWDFKYQSLSTDIYYTYRARFGLAFRPHLGLKWDWIRDKFEITYIDGGDTEFVTITQKLNAIGPSIGTGSEWNFYRNISIFGDFTWAILWANYNISYVQDEVGDTDDDINTRLKFNNGRHVADISVGLKWDYHISPRVSVALKGSWEGMIWIDYNSTWEFVDSDRDGALVRNYSNLFLQGLVVRGELHF